MEPVVHLHHEKPSRVLREWIAGLLLPLAIFVYTFIKDRADKEQRELDRIGTVIRSLGSSTPEERALARSYVEYLASHGEVSGEMVSLLSSNLSSAPTPVEAEATARTLAMVQKGDAKMAPMISHAVKDLPVRVYIQIQKDADRTTAEMIRKLLSGADVAVPGIELVTGGPEESEVRYYHPGDKAKAAELAMRLSGAGIPAAERDAAGLTSLPNGQTPEKQLELWLAPGARLASR